ncbi:MAG TPA: hypothetical protein VFB41_07240 [Solirubrobacteraceae bacterium]|nr:hypothetical protein [Solirubrobacteraceae bacterium]
MIIASNTLPGDSGYVAAAYLVFLAIVLGYVAIMAIRAARLERDVVEIAELVEGRAHE